MKVDAQKEVQARVVTLSFQDGQFAEPQGLPLRGAYIGEYRGSLITLGRETWI